MTQANARHHLAALEQDGLVEPAGERPPIGKGRPQRLYRISDRMLGGNLDGLALALLEELIERLLPDEQEEAFQRVANRMAKMGGAGSPRPGGSLTQRLVIAVQRLNTLGYAARWQAQPSAPRLILAHCPYAPLAEENPLICQIDAALMESLLSARVTHTARLEVDPKGGRFCAFLIGLAARTVTNRPAPPDSFRA